MTVLVGTCPWCKQQCPVQEAPLGGEMIHIQEAHVISRPAGNDSLLKGITLDKPCEGSKKLANPGTLRMVASAEDAAC